MATLVRWEPFRELAALQNEMSRFMNGLTEGTSRTTQSWVPALDVWETEREIVFAFDLPGIPEDKINVEFEDGALTVSAERERTEEVENREKILGGPVVHAQEVPALQGDRNHARILYCRTT